MFSSTSLAANTVNVCVYVYNMCKTEITILTTRKNYTERPTISEQYNLGEIQMQANRLRGTNAWNPLPEVLNGTPDDVSDVSYHWNFTTKHSIRTRRWTIEVLWLMYFQQVNHRIQTRPIVFSRHKVKTILNYHVAWFAKIFCIGFANDHVFPTNYLWTVYIDP